MNDEGRREADKASGSLAGRTFGRYELRSLLGSGGMGDVYRARDSGLKRDVAIKVLPDTFSRDAERVARFRREAEVLASLNHPNIAAIYDLENFGESRCLVLELVVGETLADRLKNGPVPIDDALRMAKQIAEALEAAHEKGIIHRDLKPANIKITPDGAIKVLDFGLAKVREGQDVAGVNPSDSPTVLSAEPGMMMGTPAYMSPEQARGKVVDKRSDIWAFGCVLFEMLSGRSPFARDTTTDTLVAVLERDPAWAALPASTPARVQRLLARCLDKELRGRLHDIADARIEIEDVLNAAPLSSAETAVVPSRQGPVRLYGSIAVIASVAALIAIGALMWSFLKAPGGETVPPLISRTSIAWWGTAAVNPNVNLAITPDGRSVVYVGENQIFVQPLDQVGPTPIFTATAPLNRVFISPDGQSVGFVEGNALKKVAITRGPAMTIGHAEGAGSNGAVWAPDDTIIFATNVRATGLQSVPAAGGDVTVLTRPVATLGELDHLWPEMLPGGRAVLFTITAITGGPDAAQVALFDLTTRATKVLLPGGSHAHYVPSGHLVYTARGELRAVALDLATMETRGKPVTVLPGTVTSRLGSGFFAVAKGTFAYINAPPGSSSTLVWVDRQGREDPLDLPPAFYLHPRLSRDGTQVAVAGAEIFVSDVTGKNKIPLKPDGGQALVWMPDGRLLFFGGQVMPTDGTFTASPLGSRGIPTGVTPDNKNALFTLNEDIVMVALDGTRRVEPLIQTAAFTERNGVVSPNGRWLAYESNSKGEEFEIYVQPFPLSAAIWKISTAGGKRPLWSRNGDELFYVAPDGAIMAVRADPLSSTWNTVGSPTKVVEGGPYFTTTNATARTYDVSRDGKRFLVVKRPPATQAPSPHIIVVQNWLEELKHLVH